MDFDETKLFDQTMNLVRFVKKKQDEKDIDFFQKNGNDKICDFFHANEGNFETFSEISKIVNFFFAIPGHNANCERIFSLIKSQWTDERNRLLVATVRDLVIIKFNFKSFTCSQFYKYLLKPENSRLLRKIGDSSKYLTTEKKFKVKAV